MKKRVKSRHHCYKIESEINKNVGKMGGNMKILVTGGAGFIGSNFINYLIASYPNDKIICYDVLTYAGNIHNLNIAMQSEHFQFIKGDISNQEQVFSVFENVRPDVVVNFAAESHVDRSITNPTIFLQTNILGTQVLMDACLKYGVQRFHQISTDEVYGELPLEQKDLFFTETSSLHPSSPYSASKASADLLVLSYYRTYGLPVSISRCSNNYGPYQFPEKLIPVIIHRAIENQSIPIYGNGENIRDWLYVEDHCKAIDLIIRKSQIGQVYNIGGQNERTNIQVVKTILELLNKSLSLIEYVTDRPGHDLRYATDISKIHNELGWQPTINFEEGIKYTVKWYLEHMK